METLKENFTIELNSFEEGEEVKIPAHEVETVKIESIKGIKEIAHEVKENPDYKPVPQPNTHQNEIKQVRADIFDSPEKVVPLSLKKRNEKILFEECGLSVNLPKKLEDAFLNIDSYAKN